MATMTTRSYSPSETMTPAVEPRAAVGLRVWAVLRLILGAIFFWAFLDKTFGLGFATESASSWLNGGSPTSGFLQFGTKGPFSDFYQSLAGNAFVDWLFMIGLLGIGVALLAGIGVRIAALTGAIMLVMMWTAYLSPDNHPVLDDHLVYALVLAGIAVTDAGTKWGFGRWWSKSSLVRKYPFLK